MKQSNQSPFTTLFFSLLLIGFVSLFLGCDSSSSQSDTSTAAEIPTFNNILWNVKAIHPDGQTMDVKAFNNEGKSYDVKAIQNSDQDSFLDVKAIGDGEELPVKMLLSEDPYAPVKAIDNKGATYALKAITPEGEKLDIKGVARYGYIVIMKAITDDGDFYGVKAISPTGKLNDVKGIKINFQDREMVLRGQGIHAHVKSMHPAANEEDFKIPKKKKMKEAYKNDFERIIWNVKAVTAEGKNLDVKAFDPEGNKFDVKATQDSKQHSFMHIKAFVNGYELPVKIMDSLTDAPVRAIGLDGTFYDIKALTETDEKLDIKGVSQSGNLVHIKAINEKGELYGVKAFSPDGKLNDIKGIKIFDRVVEMKSQGNLVFAHLKAINQ